MVDEAQKSTKVKEPSEEENSKENNEENDEEKPGARSIKNNLYCNGNLSIKVYS